jgi:hypothetical protein
MRSYSQIIYESFHAKENTTNILSIIGYSEKYYKHILDSKIKKMTIMVINIPAEILSMFENTIMISTHNKIPQIIVLIWNTLSIIQIFINSCEIELNSNRKCKIANEIQNRKYKTENKIERGLLAIAAQNQPRSKAKPHQPNPAKHTPSPPPKPAKPQILFRCKHRGQTESSSSPSSTA